MNGKNRSEGWKSAKLLGHKNEEIISEKLKNNLKFRQNLFNRLNIKDKFKDIIRLTNEIDLNLKQEILNIERVIRPHKDDQGNEYIMIQSSNGYKYAEGLKKDQL